MIKQYLSPSEAVATLYPGLEARVSWSYGGADQSIGIEMPYNRRERINIPGAELQEMTDYKCTDHALAEAEIALAMQSKDRPEWSHEVHVTIHIDGIPIDIKCECVHEHESIDKWYEEQAERSEALRNAKKSQMVEVMYEFHKFVVDFPISEINGSMYMVLNNDKYIMLQHDKVFVTEYHKDAIIPAQLVMSQHLFSGCEADAIYRRKVVINETCGSSKEPITID